MLLKFEFWAFMARNICEYPDITEVVHREKEKEHYLLLKREGRAVKSLRFTLESTVHRLIRDIEDGKSEFSMGCLQEQELTDTDAFRILETYKTFSLGNQLAFNFKAYLGSEKSLAELRCSDFFSKFTEEELYRVLQYREVKQFNCNWYKGLICPTSVREKLISRQQFFRYLKKKYEEKYNFKLVSY